MKKILKKILLGAVVIIILGAIIFRNQIKVFIREEFFSTIAKPVIYLYPEEETEITVELELKGELVCTYPEYKNPWEVVVQPDGTVIDKSTGLEYSYLYWEGISDVEYDMSKGFVVAGEDTADFLQKTLAQLGLIPKEYNEFIVYWLPQMQNNPYNLITFQQEAYTENALLHITPKPDSVLRVFMVYQPLEKPIDIEEPVLESFDRNGFTVVEWGGSQLNK